MWEPGGACVLPALLFSAHGGDRRSSERRKAGAHPIELTLHRNAAELRVALRASDCCGVATAQACIALVGCSCVDQIGERLC